MEWAGRNVWLILISCHGPAQRVVGRKNANFLREGYILPEPFPVAPWDVAFVHLSALLNVLDVKMLFLDNGWMCVTCTWITFLAPTSYFTGVKQKCPVEISPSSMVIQYGEPNQKATCAPSSGSLRNQEGEIFWQVQGAIRTTNASWWVDTTKDWDPRPVCTATFSGIGTCQKPLHFILYSE